MDPVAGPGASTGDESSGLLGELEDFLDSYNGGGGPSSVGAAGGDSATLQSPLGQVRTTFIHSKQLGVFRPSAQLINGLSHSTAFQTDTFSNPKQTLTSETKAVLGEKLRTNMNGAEKRKFDAMDGGGGGGGLDVPGNKALKFEREEDDSSELAALLGSPTPTPSSANNNSIKAESGFGMGQQHGYNGGGAYSHPNPLLKVGICKKVLVFN